jgi:integrase
MPTANLTDRKIASLKPGKGLVEWWDEKTPGFGIRVSPKGKKTWFVMYRFAGLRRRLKFGRYPTVLLEDARRKARKALSDVSEGKDPAQQKKAEEALQKRERLEAKTFAELAQLYLDEYAKLNKRSWKEDERIIDKLLKPEFGALNVKEITRSHVRAFLRGMAAKTRIQANRAHACLRKIFNWAIKEEIVEMEGNPASGISSPGGREKPKERNLSDEEIKAVWKEMEADSTAPKRALQLILLTGQRPGEVVGITLDELNPKNSMWTLPGNRAKNGLTNLVPLSSQALRVIERQREALESQREKREARGEAASPSALVFPCRHLAKDKPMTVYAIDQEAQRISQTLGMPGFTPHDLRRTCSTKLGEMLVPGHLIDRITNHKPTGITDRVYNRYDYLKEKQEALNAWGARLSRIVSGLELVKAENGER